MWVANGPDITVVGATPVPEGIKSPGLVAFPASSPPNPALVSVKAGGELFTIQGLRFPVGKPIKIWLVKDTGKLATIDPKVVDDKTITFSAPEFPATTQSPPFLLDILNDLLLESADSPAAFDPITIKNAHIWTGKFTISTVGSTTVPDTVKSPGLINFPATTPPKPALVSAKPGGEVFSIAGVNFPAGKPIRIWLVKDTGKLATINPKVVDAKTITFTAPEFPATTQSPPFLLDILNDLLLESASSPADFEPTTIKNAHIWTSKVIISSVGSTTVPDNIKTPGLIDFPPIKIWLVKDTGKVETIDPKVVDDKTITFKAPPFPDAQSPPFLLDILNDLLLESASSPADFEPTTIKNAHIWTSKLGIIAVGPTIVPDAIKSPGLIDFPATSPPNPALVSAKPGGELFSITGANFPAGKPIKIWLVKDTGKLATIDPKIFNDKTITFTAPEFPATTQSPPFLLDILNDLLLESADFPAAFDPFTIKNSEPDEARPDPAFKPAPALPLQRPAPPSGSSAPPPPSGSSAPPRPPAPAPRPRPPAPAPRPAPQLQRPPPPPAPAPRPALRLQRPAPAPSSSAPPRPPAPAPRPALRLQRPPRPPAPAPAPALRLQRPAPPSGSSAPPRPPAPAPRPAPSSSAPPPPPAPAPRPALRLQRPAPPPLQRPAPAPSSSAPPPPPSSSAPPRPPAPAPRPAPQLQHPAPAPSSSAPPRPPAPAPRPRPPAPAPRPRPPAPAPRPRHPSKCPAALAPRRSLAPFPRRPQRPAAPQCPSTSPLSAPRRPSARCSPAPPQCSSTP
eukprot:tig00000396_g24870.t1